LLFNILVETYSRNQIRHNTDLLGSFNKIIHFNDVGMIDLLEG
jgi:hypothetical protein